MSAVRVRLPPDKLFFFILGLSGLLILTLSGRREENLEE